jgi:hypothetical protein
MSGVLTNQYAMSYANAVNQRGTLITLRRIAPGTGPAPLVNPPTVENATLATGAASGAQVVDIAAAASGQLLAGDQIVLNGAAYTVAGNAPATPAGFVSISLAQPLLTAYSAGTAVSFNFAADQSVYAVIASMPINLVNGSAVIMGDLRVTLAAYTLGAAPKATDQIIFNGQTYSVIGVMPYFIMGVPMRYDLQARL